jgi:hypothetical protein
MKRLGIGVALVILVLIPIALVKRARAADTTPPSKMDVSSAIRLDRDMARLREAETVISKVRESVKGYDDDAMAILTAAKIDPKAFIRGDITVDFATGEITRPSSPTSAKVAKK